MGAPGPGAGRVIAGTARGIRLAAPGAATRPLGDRVKQALFAILEPELRDRPFLDLYAGSGAAGIEALSRGASRAVFVDSAADAVATIQRNLETTGLAGPRAIVRRSSVAAWLASATDTEPPDERGHEPFGVVFADPPYERLGDLDAVLVALERAGRDAVLAADGVLVAKHFWRTAPSETRLLRSARTERFGETALTFYRWSDEETA